MRRTVLTASLLVVAALALPAASAGAAPKPFGKLDCLAKNGVRFCGGGFQPTDKRIKSFDGQPLDVDVTLPPSGSGPFPLLILLHGYGQNKTTFEANSGAGRSGAPETFHNNNTWYASRGYAVVNFTARGFQGSCGSAASRAADPAGCARGWVHLDDSRFEVRDIQHLAGLLVDNGLAQPRRIGAGGCSYGGGSSLQLAMLKDKIRTSNGGLAPWKSPAGTPLRLAAAVPCVPWSDLIYSLAPNGRTLDYAYDKSDFAQHPYGVSKQSYVAGLYVSGLTAPGFYSPVGADPTADLTSWFATVQAGEPYGQAAGAAARELSRFHSAFGITGVRRPAPMFLSSGFTDDLFPPEETLRIYNKVRRRDRSFPVWLALGDLGHPRAQNKAETVHTIADQVNRFVDAYLKGRRKPKRFAEVFTETCPRSARAKGPFRAASWAKLQRGQVRLSSPQAQTVTATGGSVAGSQALDPVFGSGACTKVSSADAAGTANYRLLVTRAFTLAGLPTIDAQVKVTGANSELAAHLYDVDQSGKAILVARGVYRPTGPESRIIFQLFGNAYRFQAGHTLKLELAGRDAPFLRPSNNTAFTIDVNALRLFIPTLERPRGLVKAKQRLPLPPGGHRVR